MKLELGDEQKKASVIRVKEILTKLEADVEAMDNELNGMISRLVQTHKRMRSLLARIEL